MQQTIEVIRNYQIQQENILATFTGAAGEEETPIFGESFLPGRDTIISYNPNRRRFKAGSGYGVAPFMWKYVVSSKELETSPNDWVQIKEDDDEFVVSDQNDFTYKAAVFTMNVDDTNFKLRKDDVRDYYVARGGGVLRFYESLRGILNRLMYETINEARKTCAKILEIDPLQDLSLIHI